MRYAVRITHKNPDDKMGTVEHVSFSEKISQSEALIRAIVHASNDGIDDFENYSIVIEQRENKK